MNIMKIYENHIRSQRMCDCVFACYVFHHSTHIATFGLIRNQ